MIENENVQFPKHYKPLPAGYRIVQLDSGHYMWVWGTPEQVAVNDYMFEGPICWDKWWVRRCVFKRDAELGMPL